MTTFEKLSALSVVLASVCGDDAVVLAAVQHAWRHLQRCPARKHAHRNRA
jgi:hypothetical protein